MRFPAGPAPRETTTAVPRFSATRVGGSVLVRRPPAEVWELVVDPRGVRAQLPKGGRLELVTDRIDEVGARWTTIAGQGRRATEVSNELVELVPERLHVVRSTWPRATGTVRTVLEPAAGGTRVIVEATFDWRPGLRSLPARLMTALAGSRLTQQALERLKSHAEGAASRDAW